MITRQELKEKVPYGYCKVIALRACVSQKSVSEYLSGTTKHSEKIETATLEVLAELNQKKKALIAQIN